LQVKRTQTLISDLRTRGLGGRVNDLQIEFIPREQGGGSVKPPPAEGVNVTLTPADGGDTLHALTDAEGVLTMSVVPSGKYVVTADLPKGQAIDQMFGQTWKGKPAMVEIPGAQGGAACHYVMFVRPSGIVSGEVVDATGKRTTEQVSLTLVNANSRGSGVLDLQSDGSFTTRFVASGTYYLKFFLGNDYQHPWFYPGVRSEAEAKAIVVGDGEQVEGIRVVLPRSDGLPTADPGTKQEP